jgi:hypothetical protein
VQKGSLAHELLERRYLRANRWPVAVAAFVVLVSLGLVAGMEYSRKDTLAENYQLRAVASDARAEMYRAALIAYHAADSKRLNLNNELEQRRTAWAEIERRAVELGLATKPKMAKGAK